MVQIQPCYATICHRVIFSLAIFFCYMRQSVNAIQTLVLAASTWLHTPWLHRYDSVGSGEGYHGPCIDSLGSAVFRTLPRFISSTTQAFSTQSHQFYVAFDRSTPPRTTKAPLNRHISSISPSHAYGLATLFTKIRGWQAHPLPFPAARVASLWLPITLPGRSHAPSHLSWPRSGAGGVP